MSCGVGLRCGSDPALQWLWCRPAIVPPIGPPSLGTSICHRFSPKKQNKTKKQKKNIFLFHFILTPILCGSQSRYYSTILHNRKMEIKRNYFTQSHKTIRDGAEIRTQFFRLLTPYSLLYCTFQLLIHLALPLFTHQLCIYLIHVDFALY